MESQVIELQGLVYPIISLLIVAVLTEACVEMTKSFMLKQFTERGKRILSFFFATVLAFIFDISIFTAQPQTAPYFIGILMAGMIASRGSNYIHEFSNILEGIATMKNATKK